MSRPHRQLIAVVHFLLGPAFLAVHAEPRLVVLDAPRRDYLAGKAPVAVVAADFDHDGRMDVATADSGSSSVSVLLADGRGGFQKPLYTAVDSQPAR